ncbi:MAG: hypothetical protein ACOC4E_01400 [Patescibacteria group bacterium]
MHVKLQCAAGTCGALKIDYTGDGTTDSELDWTGLYKLTPNKEITPDAKPAVSSGVSQATRIRPPANPEGRVAGVSTEIAPEDLQRMWEKVMQIKQDIEEIKMYLSSII